MQWKTMDIYKDLCKLVPDWAHVIIDHEPKGGHDTPEIMIKGHKGGDCAWCTGYNTQECFSDEDVNNLKWDNPVWDIPYVEIRSAKSDSEGGLSPYASDKTRELYFILNDYFRRKKVQIIKHYDEIF